MTDTFITTPNAVDGEDPTETIAPFAGESARTWDTPPEVVIGEDQGFILSQYLQAVLPIPSDRVIFRTVTLNNNDTINGPTLLVNRQLTGVGCRARLRNTGAAGVVWLLIDANTATPSVTPGQVYSDGFPLAVGAELELVTRSAIWAISPGAPGTTQVSVTVETYEGGDQQ